MVIQIYTQLDHSLFEAAWLETGCIYEDVGIFHEFEWGCRVLV